MYLCYRCWTPIIDDAESCPCCEHEGGELITENKEEAQ